MRKSLLVVAALLLFLIAGAQDAVWQQTDKSTFSPDLFAAKTRPAEYQLFKLNEAAFLELLRAAPHEKNVRVSQSTFVVQIPDETGALKSFRIVKAPALGEKLSAKYPDILSFAGQGTDDPSVTTRFAMSPFGFDGTLFRRNGSAVYIRAVNNSSQLYTAVSKDNINETANNFSCNVSGARTGTVPDNSIYDGKLRTYSLAVAASGEYSQEWLDGTEPNDAAKKAKVTAALNSLLTFINGVYERDFSVRLQLADDNDAVIYLDPATDPFGPYSSDYQWNSEAHTACLPADNTKYNVGQSLLYYPGGAKGNAGDIGVVCILFDKDRGWSATNDFRSNQFRLVVAHELGHQFGANHTFTYRTEPGTGAQVEPGSGSTIMSYAGIISPPNNNVTLIQDDYFHAKSIEQVTDYVKSPSGNQCAVITVTGNAAPSASAGAAKTIPPATYFALTGSGTDSDASDVLSYVWEQMDVGTDATSIPIDNKTSTEGPMFRSVKPAADVLRYFPGSSGFLINSYGSRFEALPEVSRDLNFRFTVRDNHPGGGSVKTSDVKITVDGALQPFRVIQPQQNEILTTGSTYTVKWTPGTLGLSANVSISMSRNGGGSFDEILLPSTPNTGSAEITVPSLPTPSGKLKIAAVENVFFDVSKRFQTVAFAVSNPNAAINVEAGAPLNVTWTGTTTSLSPNVKISLSTNGGASFPYVLLASTPNDNAEAIILPNLPTTNARIKVESIGANVFSDSSDFNFTITAKPGICQKLNVEVFKRDTSFTCVTSDDNGNVYAGTQTKGLYKYSNSELKNYSSGLLGLIPWKRTWMRQMTVYNNQLWVAHSGYISPIGLETDNYRYGGVERIDLLNGPGSRQNYRGQRVINIDLTIGGPATRNTFGILADTATGRIWSVSNYADSLSYPPEFNYNARYWYKTGGVAVRAPGQSNFFRNETGLPAPFALGVGTGTAGTESLSVGKRRNASAITTDSSEVLVSVSGFRATTADTVFTAGLMRYNRYTGAFIGKYDQRNTPIPFGLTNTSPAAPALYTDVKGRVWVAVGGNRLAVKDTSGWRYIGVPGPLAGGGTIQPNAISGDSKGVIYFGTDKGLLIFNNNKATDSTAGSYLADSSYCLYTTADGLSTNYIRGTHVDRNGNIWLATGAGVCKVQRGDLLMYNLLPVQGGVYATNDEKKRTSVAAFDPETTNTDTIRIAADGSKATLLKWTGINPNKLRPVIKEGSTTADFGKLAVLYRGTDSLVIQYQHPDYLSEPYLTAGKREITFQLFDTTVSPQKKIIEVKMYIVPPPVLCLHGIWSSGDAHNLIKQYLIDSAGYKKFMISNPDYPNDVYFNSNKFAARDAIAALLLQCADNNMSAGRADVIGHSMGGILSRVFLQSAEYDSTFHKLITINTPHSGSQIADLVRTNPALALIVDGILGNNTENGALEDLRVTKDGIRVLLNGPSLNKNKVPSHAITSRYTDLQTYELLVNVTLTIASYIPALGRIAAVAKRMLAILKYTAYAGTTCNTSESVHNCLKNKIFEDDNDLAVALVSQRGGLPASAISYYDNISHNAILDRQEVFTKLVELLKKKTTDGSFTAGGFNPPVLNYNAALRTASSPSAETMTINSPVSGSTYSAGQNISIDVSGSANIQKILIASGNATLGMGYYNSQTQSYVLNYNIPKEAIGKLYIVAVGFDNLGKSTYDSAFINVSIPAGVTLDSISIGNKRGLKVYRDDSLWLKITGYYSDTVRDISNVEGISFAIDDVNIRMSNARPNTIIGVIEGYDNFRASWQGKTDTGYVEILPKRVIPPGGGVIPVTLTSFTGRLQGNAVRLKWNTAQEINSSHFDIERSADGIRFEKTGTVNARGNSSTGTDYSFDDLQYKTGANYYRLKQVDADGRFTYSVVILIRVNKDSRQEILIYPNPAGKYINVNVTEGLHPQWTLKLSSITGQQLLTHTIPANQNNEQVQLPKLPHGIYTVTVLAAGGEKIYNGKLVVQQ